MMPRPNSLISRVHKLLDDPTDPSEIARVAREYIRLCEQVDQRVKQFTRLIRDGHYYAAMDLEHLAPPLTALIEQVRFPREQEWNRLLEQSGLPVFQGFNDHELKRVKEICSDSHSYQPPGYREYRKAMLQGDHDGALLSLRKLASENPRDLNARAELTRIEKQVFDRLSLKLAGMIAHRQREEILETVAKVLEQTWVTPLHSESWEKAHAIYVEEENSKTEAQLRQCMTQIMVIQRVGSWKDAEPLIAKLKAFTKHSAFANWPPEDRGSLQAMLDWFHDQEQRQQLREKLQKQLHELVQQLDPGSFDPAIRDLGKRQRSKVERSLLAEWTELQQQAPDLCDPYAFVVQGALRKLNEAPAAKGKGGFPGLLLRITGILALIFTLFATIGLAISHHGDREQADLIRSLHDQGAWTQAESAIRNWNDRSDWFRSTSNPFRNHAAHQDVANIHHRIQELRSRQGKAVELLNRATNSMDRDPPLSELRRIQVNIQLASELLDPLLASEDSRTVRQQLISSKDRVEELVALKREQTRNQIQKNLNELSAAIERELNFNRSRIAGIEIPIARIRNGLQQVRLQLRQAFDDDGLADLGVFLQSLEEQVNQFETSLKRHQIHRDALGSSRKLADYLRHIADLAALPFVQDPVVRAAGKVWSLKDDLENPARALLMPNSAVAWQQFLENATQPLFPKSPDSRESQRFRQLVEHPFLSNIHRYQLDRYSRGTTTGPKQHFYGDGSMKTFRESSTPQGRIVQTLKLMDETRFHSGGEPFTEQVFVGTTDATGRPWEGDFITSAGLSPESLLFRDLPRLAGFDADANSFQVPILATIDAVKTSDTDPLFKAFVTQELIQLLTFRVFDWGLNFSPSLQLDYRRLKGIAGTLSSHDWLLAATQKRLKPALEDYYQKLSSFSYHDQANASRSLFRAVAEQEIQFAGYVTEGGEMLILDGAEPPGTLFGFNDEGRLTILPNPNSPKSAVHALPLTPILNFPVSPSEILDRVSSEVSFDLQSESFRPFLPSIFDD